MTCRIRIGGGLLFASLASMASASIILVSPIEQTGTGLGAVNTVLTITSPANSTIETGCVAPSGSGTTTSGCGFADSNVQAAIGTPTLSAAGVASAADLRIVFNASEPANASDIQLNALVLTLYNSSGTAISTHSIAAPIFFSSTLTGTGNSGFVFQLDPGQANSAQSAIDTAGGLGVVRVGLGASAGVAGGGPGSATGGLETFFVEGSSTIGGGGGGGGGAVPEPATNLLIGAGLVGLVAIKKRFRSA
jgi:hypothetical protein